MQRQKTAKTQSGGNYDWFQGKSNKLKSMTPKQRIKKIWKIIRIFLYVILASLSLTGCVQSFIIKVHDQTGLGMELYSHKEDVAPQTNTLEEVTAKDLADTPFLIYHPEINYWVKDKVSLEKLHNSVDLQSPKKSGGFTKWATENHALRIIKGGETNKPQIYTDGNKIAVIGETQNKTNWCVKKNPPEIKINNYYLKEKKLTKSEDIYIKKPATSVVALFSLSIFSNLQTHYLNPIANKLNRLVEKKLMANDLKKIKKLLDAYHCTLSSMSSLTGVLLASKNSKFYLYLDMKKSLFGFNQSSKTKQRAIYNWNKAWNLGPFYALFVYPLSRLTLSLSDSLPSSMSWHGWETILAIFITVVIIRTFAYGLTFKSTLQQVKQQELSSKRAAIEAKYIKYKGNKQMENRKRQELSAMFKKEGISPLGAIGSAFLTMPIFIAMWKIIGGVSHFKSTMWLKMNFSSTSWREMLKGSWQYLPLMLMAGTIQAISLFIPRLLANKRNKNRINIQQKSALKKANKTQNIMSIVMIFMSFIFTAGVQVYWIFGGMFMIGQNVLNHFIIKWQSKRRKRKK